MEFRLTTKFYACQLLQNYTKLEECQKMKCHGECLEEGHPVKPCLVVAVEVVHGLGICCLALLNTTMCIVLYILRNVKNCVRNWLKVTVLLYT